MTLSKTDEFGRPYTHYQQSFILDGDNILAIHGRVFEGSKYYEFTGVSAIWTPSGFNKMADLACRVRGRRLTF
jgi:hypothetical protein